MIDWFILRDDKIFWIGNLFDEFDEFQFKIFEILESNGAFHVKSFRDFESKKNQFFPQLVTPMQNGKFIFYPEFVTYEND